MERFKYWTAEDDQFMRENWSAITLDQLADKLGRTRNSVAGRIHRLGLPIKVIRQPRTVKTERKERQPHRENSPVPPPPVTLHEALLLRKYSCTMEELDRTRCRWPIGDPRSGDFRYCGVQEANFPKVAYCNYHRLAQYDLGRKQ